MGTPYRRQSILIAKLFHLHQLLGESCPAWGALAWQSSNGLLMQMCAYKVR